MKAQEIKTFDQLIDTEHGQIGTDKRNAFEENAHRFIISEMLKLPGIRKMHYNSRAVMTS